MRDWWLRCWKEGICCLKSAEKHFALNFKWHSHNCQLWKNSDADQIDEEDEAGEEEYCHYGPR